MTNPHQHGGPLTREVEGFDMESDGTEAPGGTNGNGGGHNGGSTMEAMIAQFHAYEAAEEAKIPPGEDGHEPDSGSGVDPEAGEVDELADGTVGTAAAEADAGVYAESAGLSEVNEVADFEDEVLDFGGEHFETVFGRDDRERVGNTGVYPWRTICKLEITAADGARFGCSGALIGPRTVLTNGHCVYMHDHGGWVRSIRVIPGKNASVEPYGAAVSTFYHSVKGWTNSQSANRDYGAVILPANAKLGNVTGWMGLANLSFTSLLGLRVNTSGYPGDKPYGTQWWNANNVLAVTARRLFYRLDTYGGQSGSPVWRFKDGKRHIVAVHNTGGPVYNGSVRLAKPVFDNLVKWKNTYT